MNRTPTKSWITSAFPVPASLMLADTSIEISDGMLRYFQCDRKHGVVIPKDFGTTTFPRLNIEQNEKAKTDATGILREWSSTRKQRIVNSVIHEAEAYVFKISVPTTNPKEIPSAIEALLEENVPIPPSEAVFEYTVIASDEKLNETTVAVSALPKKAVIEHIELLRSGGLVVASLETEARGIARALCPKDDTSVRAVLSISEKHSVVFIAERGSVVFSSSIEVGSRDFDKGIAKIFGVTEEAARVLKHQKASQETEGDAKLFEAILTVSSTIRDELSKVLAYWKSQGKKEREFVDVSEVVLLGSDSMLPGFSQYISSISKLPTRIGSVWTNTQSPEVSLPSLHKIDSLSYAAVIGALL